MKNAPLELDERGACYPQPPSPPPSPPPSLSGGAKASAEKCQHVRSEWLYLSCKHGVVN